MAKQTKTGGAYQNYQVIKTGDTTGSSKALAQGVADIASTVVQNTKNLNASRAKELERFNKAKKTIASQVQARETSRQNALLDAGAAIEGSTLSETMRGDYTAAMETEVYIIGENQAVLDNPYAGNEAKKEANTNIFKAKGLIASLNLSLKKSQEMQVGANANIARRQSVTKNWNYSSIEKDGIQDNGTTMSGWDNAHVGGKGTTMGLYKKDGKYFLKGSGGSEETKDAWNYETDISSYNNPKYSTTTDYTPVIPEASQQVVDQMYQVVNGKSTGKIDPSLIMKNDKGEELTIMHTDGIQYTEIDPKTFNANITSSATTASAKFDAINNVEDRNNVLLDQLKLTREEGTDLYSDDSETSGLAMKKFKKGILEKIRGEALASLNLKEIGDNLYKVSDVQSPKPKSNKLTPTQIDRIGTINTITKKFTSYGVQKTKDDFANAIKSGLSLGEEFSIGDDGNIIMQTDELDQAAMDASTVETDASGKVITPKIYKKKTFSINSDDKGIRRNALTNFIEERFKLSYSQADDLAKELLKNRKTK
tara:strand:+ start:7875 stop:9488 length:1614 start_codon:yes stop_codon:yes gene_type:complete